VRASSFGEPGPRCVNHERADLNHRFHRFHRFHGEGADSHKRRKTHKESPRIRALRPWQPDEILCFLWPMSVAFLMSWRQRGTFRIGEN
jgi:hypothetical protein